MTPSRGQRGKYAEKEVERLFKKLNDEHLGFAWHRYPDTRSARSFIKAQPCDYLVSCGTAIHIEVKETEHEFRLPSGRISQLPVLKKFALAGIQFFVLVFHSTLKKWRCVPECFFEGDTPPSWDLKGLPLHYTAEDALLAQKVIPTSKQ